MRSWRGEGRKSMEFLKPRERKKNLRKTKGKTNWENPERNQPKKAPDMKCMDQNEPAGRTPRFLNPLGQISNCSSGSLQRRIPIFTPWHPAWAQVGPSDKPQVGWLFPLRPTSVLRDSKPHVLVTQIRIQRRKRRRKILWHGSQGSPNASKTPRKRENDTWKLVQSYQRAIKPTNHRHKLTYKRHNHPLKSSGLTIYHS